MSILITIINRLYARAAARLTHKRRSRMAMDRLLEAQAQEQDARPCGGYYTDSGVR